MQIEVSPLNVAAEPVRTVRWGHFNLCRVPIHWYIGAFDNKPERKNGDVKFQHDSRIGIGGAEE